ncbi:unnamed protein product [Closterium sp. Naga37s-1]|nr:unnamed protein product [Closterium sp. Naga37s-1]
MAEAVAVVRAKKQAEANSEREAVLTRSESLLDEKFDAYEAANYRMWARSKSEAFSRRKPSGTRSHKNHNLDFLDSYGFAPQNAELMTRVEESSSFNQGYGSNGFFRGDCEESGAAERMAEEGRLGGEGLKTKGARDSSGSSSSGNSGSSASSHESAAEDERGLRGFLRHCRKKDRRASAPDQSCADGAEGGEGKATAPGAALLKRSLTGDTEGKTMSTMDTTADKAMERGALNGVTESMTGGTLLRSASDALQDAEMDEMDREVLQEAFLRVVGLQQRVQYYRDLGGFVVLMALFITILYLQADSSRSYEITAAHAVLFPPSSSLTLRPACVSPRPPREQGMRQDASNTFNGPDDFYSWLNTSIVQSLWADLTCGDGTCHHPFQFPAFGRFGCQADCGTFPNLTSVVVRLSSQLDTQQAADESSWNLCMVNPVSLCWYESFQPFPRGETEVSVAVDIPDGDWVVVLNAPAGGIRGTVHAPPPGTRRFSVVGAASTVELAAWGYCALDDGVAAANQTEPSGGAAGASPDICRDTCARLVVCLPATCGRAFTEREVAGAFVDCARMCIVAPSSITTYADTPCPMPDIASLFSNTPCNVSGMYALATCMCQHPTLAFLTSFRSCHAHVHHRTFFHHHLRRHFLPHGASLAPCSSPCPMVRPLPHGAPPAPWCAPCPMPIAFLLPLCPRPQPTLPVSPSLLPATQLFFQCLFTHPLQPEIASLFANTPCNVSGSDATARLPQSSRRKVMPSPLRAIPLCVIHLLSLNGKQVMTLADMFAYLKYRHIGHMISAQHMVRWVQTVAAAVSSVTPVPDVAAARLNALMHSFNDAIISSNGVGCSQGAHGRWSWWWLDA